MESPKTNDDEIACPQCSRVWPVGCEQWASIRLYAECMVCRFVCRDLMDRSAETTAELAAITDLAATTGHPDSA